MTRRGSKARKVARCASGTCGRVGQRLEAQEPGTRRSSPPWTSCRARGSTRRSCPMAVAASADGAASDAWLPIVTPAIGVRGQRRRAGAGGDGAGRPQSQLAQQRHERARRQRGGVLLQPLHVGEGERAGAGSAPRTRARSDTGRCTRSRAGSCSRGRSSARRRCSSCCRSRAGSFLLNGSCANGTKPSHSYWPSLPGTGIRPSQFLRCGVSATPK